MATTKAKKQDQLTALIEKFKASQGVAFISFNQATVMDVQAARRDLRENGMSYVVIKKTLMAIAAKEAGICEFDSDDLEGNVAVIVSETDAIAPSAAIKKLIKLHYNKVEKTSKFDYAGAIFEGKFQDKAATAILAETPTREESLAKIVGALRSGPQKLHSVFQSGLRKNINVLQNADKFAKAA